MGALVFRGILVMALAGLFACAAGPCKNEMRGDEGSAPLGFAPNPNKPEVTMSDRETPSYQRLLVFKFDGTLQCQGDKAIPLETMQKELTDAGIQVFSAKHQSSGFMMTQVCGSPTGMINLYEIPKRDLDKAQALGFKEWMDPEKF